MSAPLYYSQSFNDVLYARALTSAWRAGYRVSDPDYALSREPDIWEVVRRDPVIAHAIMQLTLMVAGNKYVIEPASDSPSAKTAAALVKAATKKVGGFMASRHELCNGLFVARSFQYMEGMRRRMRLTPDTPELDWWVCTRMRDVDRRRIRIAPRWSGAGENVQLGAVQEIYSVSRERWEEWQNPEQFIKLVYDDSEDRLGYGRGLIEAIYFYHYLKVCTLREGQQGLERWAQGFLLGKIDGLRIGSATKTNDAVRDEYLDFLKKIRGRNVGVIDKNDELQLIQHSGTGHQMVTDYLNYFDNGITRLILGSILPTGGDAGTGSLARSETEADTQSLRTQFFKGITDECITRDYIGQWWRLNTPQLASLGLTEDDKPAYASQPEMKADPEKAARIVKKMLSVPGVQLKKSEVHEKIGFAQPAEGDEVYEGSAPTSPGGFSFDPLENRTRGGE